MEDKKNTTKFLYSHTCQETALAVSDYPWGFRLRTTIRYWIESKDSKNGGQRFCSQTINPKTGCWCEPKKTTYMPIMVMFLDENNHVKYTGLRFNDSEEKIDAFRDQHLNFLSDFQKKSLKEIMAYNQVMKKVEFKVCRSEIGPVSLFSNDPQEVEKRKKLVLEQEQKKQEHNKVLLKICHDIEKTAEKIEL